MNNQNNNQNPQKKKKLTKLQSCLGCATIFILIIVIALIVDISNDKPVNNSEDTKNSASTNSNKSDEDVIKDTIKAKYSGKNNRNQDTIRSIRVTPQVDGGYGVMVEFNADEGLSLTSTRKDIIYTSSQMLKTIYKETGKTVKQAGIFAYYPLTDKYGNSSDGLVYKCTLDKEIADKVNWDQEEGVLFGQILPNLWNASNDLLK